VSSPVTGAPVSALIVIWLAVVYLIAPSLGLYYERFAAWYTLPPLGLIYLYCLSHRRRGTAYLAIATTVIAILILGFAIMFPKGSAA
jgi:uncharacterized membrane protein